MIQKQPGKKPSQQSAERTDTGPAPLQPPTKSVAYARVSSEVQEERETIKPQIDTLKRYVSSQGDSLVTVYTDDGYSGELLERPGLDQLRNDATKKLWKRVYILSPDRLARKPHIAGLVIDELQEQDIEVIFVNRPLGETIEDRLLFGVQSLFAEYEKEKFKERQRRGKLYKARKGNVVGGQPPYGYTYIKCTDTEPGRYEINAREAEIVRMIYDWYISGQCDSYRQIAKELYKKGIRTRTGSEKWSCAIISNILTDLSYIGTTYYNKRRRVPGKSKKGVYRRNKNTRRVFRDRSDWIPISIPALVSQQQFDKVQQIKPQNVRLSPRHAKEKYLVKNLITCGECGSALYGASKSNASGYHYSFYYCSLKMRRYPAPTDHSFTVKRDLVDSVVWSGLKEILTSPQVLMAKLAITEKTITASTGELEEQLEGLSRKQEQLMAKRRRVVDAYTESLLTREEFERASEEFTVQNATLTLKRAKVEEKLSHSPEPMTLKRAEEIAAAYVREVQQPGFEEKRKLVQAFVEKAVMDKRELVVQCTLPTAPKKGDSLGIAFRSSIRSERNRAHFFEFRVPIRTVGRRYVAGVPSS